MLRDPVYPDRYWNGICVVPTAQRWPHGIKGTGIKFGTTGKRWASRKAALTAYAEYEITVSLIYMKKASSNMDWHKLPSSLELVEVEVGHRVGSAESRPHMDAAMRALKHEASDTFLYMFRVPNANAKDYANRIKAQIANLGIDAPLICFPYFFVTNEADLLGAKLAIDLVKAWEFKTERSCWNDRLHSSPMGL